MLLIDLVKTMKSWGELTLSFEPLKIHRKGILQFVYTDKVVYHNLHTNAEVRAYNQLLEWLGSDDRFVKAGRLVFLKSEVL